MRDVDASLRFYRDGLGLAVLMDERFDGDWPSLFDAPSTRLHSVFLGEPTAPDAGVVELVTFDRDVDAGRAAPRPATGFFLLSFFVDLAATLARLDELGLGGAPRRTEQPGPGGSSVAMATVRDPDGVLVELVEAGSARA